MMDSSVEQYTVVLPTKLIHPRSPATLVVRDRLMAQLNTVLSHRLTLVSASAGWGKTTLLASWRSQQGSGAAASDSDSRSLTSAPSVAWLSLDELDNDPKRFWVGFITALRTCLVDVGTLALGMLDSPEQPPLTVVLTALLNDLATEKALTALVLILDDFHVITNGAVTESLTFLLEHLPSDVHLVLA